MKCRNALKSLDWKAAFWPLAGLVMATDSLYRVWRGHGHTERMDAVGSGLIGLAILFTLAALVLHQGKFRRATAPLVGVAAILLIVGFVAMIASEFTFPSLWRTASLFYMRLQGFFGGWFRLTETMVLAVCGISLYRLKTKHLLLYAYLETIAAVLTCYAAVQEAQTAVTPGILCALAGGVYLIVRGLEDQDRARTLHRATGAQPETSPGTSQV